MTIEELHELCVLTAELTRLRQNACKHLCIENFAPEVLGKLIRERQGATSPPWTADSGIFTRHLDGPDIWGRR